MNYEKTVKAIRTELKNYVQKNKLQSLVIGISGGIDSCLCAALARPVCYELNVPLIGVSLPCSTNESEEISRASTTGSAFCTEFSEVSIQKYFELLSNDFNNEFFEKDLSKDIKIRNGNIKARIRMIYLYNLASQYRGMVLSTDNLTELLLGFWTLHGDVGDYGMIQNFWKTEVYDIAEWIAVNEYRINNPARKILVNTIDSMATDGLGVTNLGDLGQILPEWKGNSRDGYKEVDRILQIWLERNGLEETQCKIITEGYKNHPVIKRHLSSEFKRNNPINLARYKIVKY